jgi:hypothetical protein
LRLDPRARTGRRGIAGRRRKVGHMSPAILNSIRFFRMVYQPSAEHLSQLLILCSISGARCTPSTLRHLPLLSASITTPHDGPVSRPLSSECDAFFRLVVLRRLDLLRCILRWIRPHHNCIDTHNAASWSMGTHRRT